MKQTLVRVNGMTLNGMVKEGIGLWMTKDVLQKRMVFLCHGLIAMNILFYGFIASTKIGLRS